MSIGIYSSVGVGAYSAPTRQAESGAHSGHRSAQSGRVFGLGSGLESEHYSAAGVEWREAAGSTASRTDAAEPIRPPTHSTPIPQFDTATHGL
jgi:hypothetical protein